MAKLQISFSDIERAAARLAPYIKKTPLKKSAFFSKAAGRELFLKYESEQEIKSFKIRGALNKVLSLTEEEKKRGLIAASAGNHAQGAAFAARCSGAPVRVVMMETASLVKIKAAKNLGAKVILKGKTYEESYAHAQAIKGDSIFIHPFADPLVIAGQGSIGLELLRELPDISSVVVAVGGGGLLSGVSLAVKTLKPDCRVYGVVWEGTPSFCRKYHKLKKAGAPRACGLAEPPPADSKSGLTDGIAVRSPLREKTLAFCAPFVDDVACVSEKEISQTIADIAAAEGHVAEGSGAAALAGALKRKNSWNLGEKCCAVISGGNIDPAALSEAIKKSARRQSAHGSRPAPARREKPEREGHEKNHHC